MKGLASHSDRFKSLQGVIYVFTQFTRRQ